MTTFPSRMLLLTAGCIDIARILPPPKATLPLMARDGDDKTSAVQHWTAKQVWKHSLNLEAVWDAADIELTASFGQRPMQTSHLYSFEQHHLYTARYQQKT